MLINLHFDCQWWLDIYSLQFIKWLSMQFYYHFNYQWLLCIIIFINGSVMIWKGINFTVYINNVSRMIIYYLCFRWLYIIIYYIQLHKNQMINGSCSNHYYSSIINLTCQCLFILILFVTMLYIIDIISDFLTICCCFSYVLSVSAVLYLFLPQLCSRSYLSFIQQFVVSLIIDVLIHYINIQLRCICA